jgi:hypothetical protein
LVERKTKKSEGKYFAKSKKMAKNRPIMGHQGGKEAKY